MRYEGIIEETAQVEADSEEEAKRKLAELLIDRLRSGDAGFVAWPLP